MDNRLLSSAGPPESVEVIRSFGYLGHYLHVHSGGRCGKQFILVTLANKGGHLTQRELADHCTIRSASLSEVLSKLEGEGLITRTVSETDRRQLDVSLTDEGSARAAHYAQERSDFEEQALACLDAHEVTLLRELLERVCTHWRKLEEREVAE
jgi:DNA-binding MarR family transcriptional regulator